MPRSVSHVVGADVLRDAAGFARRHLGAADVVQQRGLAVVDVAHDGDHRGARQRFAFGGADVLFGERFRIVQRGRHGLVAHFLDHDHGRVLVQRLVDGDHLAQLHQVLDHLGRLHGHLVRELGHRDGFGHVHFDHAGFDRRALHVIVAMVALVAAAAARARRASCCGRRRPSCRRGSGMAFFLAGSPAQLDDSLADLTSLPAPPGPAGAAGARGRTAGSCAHGGLVQRALGSRLGRLGLGHGLVPAACARPAPSWARTSSNGSRRLRPRPCGGARPGRRRARLPRRHAPWTRLPPFRGLRAARRHAAAAALAASWVASAWSADAWTFFCSWVAACVAARSSASRSRLSLSSRWRRFSARSSSWRRISSAWRRASSSRRASSASSMRCGGGCLHLGLGRLDHGRVAAFVALDEGALLANLDLDGARLAGRVGLLDLAGGFLHQGDLLALGAWPCHGWPAGSRAASACRLR